MVSKKAILDDLLKIIKVEIVSDNLPNKQYDDY
jgi:hypothetical protein